MVPEEQVELVSLSEEQAFATIGLTGESNRIQTALRRILPMQITLNESVPR